MLRISTPTKNICEATQNYLFKLGYQWIIDGICVIQTNNILVDINHGFLYTCDKHSEYPVTSLYKIPKYEPPLTLGGKRVTVENGDIIVDDLVISKDEIQRLYNILKDLK